MHIVVWSRRGCEGTTRAVALALRCPASAIGTVCSRAAVAPRVVPLTTAHKTPSFLVQLLSGTSQGTPGSLPGDVSGSRRDPWKSSLFFHFVLLALERSFCFDQVQATNTHQGEMSSDGRGFLFLFHENVERRGVAEGPRAALSSLLGTENSPDGGSGVRNKVLFLRLAPERGREALSPNIQGAGDCRGLRTLDRIPEAWILIRDSLSPSLSSGC